jgi:hypothetical protein
MRGRRTCTRSDLATRLGDECGSGLIMLMGIIVTLAILAVAVVMVTMNMQDSSMQDRLGKKAFNVAEAALDSGMASLARTWPLASGTGPDLGTTAQSAFRALFSASEYPDPTVAGRHFVTWQLYDNLNPVDTSITWDKGAPDNANLPDNRMWLVAQAGVGKQAARIRTLVERSFYDSNIPRGVALYTGASLMSNGGGNNPKITVEVPPASGQQTTVRVAQTIDDTTVAASNIVELQGSAAGTVEEVFPSSLKSGLKTLAQAHDRYFTSVADAQNSPVDSNWAPTGGVSGLTVIEPTTSQTLSLRGDYNTSLQPGIILMLGTAEPVLDFGSGGNYWGVLYTDGHVDKGHGSFTVHGMLVSASNVDMRGTVNLVYNDDVLSRLNARWSLNIRIVPNTWRELKPN